MDWRNESERHGELHLQMREIMKHIRIGLISIALCAALSQAQVTPGPNSQSTAVSGTSLYFGNALTAPGGMTPTFEEKIAGSPATVSIITQGCMRGGTCDSLDTYTTVANANRAPSVSKIYDYFVVTPSWTGGTSPSVTVNYSLAQAALGTASGGSISGVTAGTGLNGGGSSGTVTLNVTDPNTSSLQGYEQVGDSSSGASPSSNAIHAEKYCSGGFNASTGACVSGSEQQAIHDAIAAAVAVGINDVDARAFFKDAVFLNSGTGATPLTLYGGVTPGGSVPVTLWLGQQRIACDGPSAGYYSDGSSQVGTPCLIIPSNLKLHLAGPTQTVFAPCTGTNTPVTGCTTAFPQRVCSISSITGSSTNYTVNITSASCTGMGSNTSLVATGGFGNNENIWVGELAQTVTGTALSSLTRAVLTVPTATSFTIHAESANAPTCASSCGSVYFYTALLGYGTGNSSATACNFGVAGAASPCPYTPVQALNGSQSFQQSIYGGMLMNLESMYGVVGLQNVNAGEGTEAWNPWCEFVATACFDFGPGDTDSGPIINSRITNLAVTTNTVASTIGAYIGGTMKGFLGPDCILTYSGAANQPWGCYQIDGTTLASGSTIDYWHTELSYSGIELAPNLAVRGARIGQGLGPPTGAHAGVVGVRFLNDGAPCEGCVVEATVNQTGGYTYGILDDFNSNNCTDLALGLYMTDVNGHLSQTNCVNGSITSGNVINGNGITVGGQSVLAINPPSAAGVQNVIFPGSSAGASTGYPGVAVDPNSETTCSGGSLSYLDRGGYIKCSGGTTATFTLVAASGNTASNFPFVICNLNTGVLTITPTTPNNIDGQTSQASDTLQPNYCDFVYQDSGSPINWWTIPLGTYGAAHFLKEQAAPGSVPSATAVVYDDSTTHDVSALTEGSTTGGIIVHDHTHVNAATQTASISTATLCAASAGACDQSGYYHISWSFGQGGTACTSVGSGGVSIQFTWTDAAGTTHSAITVPMIDSSSSTAISSKFTFQTTNAAAFATGELNVFTNGSIIQYATTYTACTTGTGTYTLRASVVRLY